MNIFVIKEFKFVLPNISQCSVDIIHLACLNAMFYVDRSTVHFEDAWPPIDHLWRYEPAHVPLSDLPCQLDMKEKL